MTTYSIELDIAGEDGYEARTKAWAKKFKCQAKVVTHNGPGGGNPVYRFTAPSKDGLVALVKDYAAGTGLNGQDLQDELEELYFPSIEED